MRKKLFVLFLSLLHSWIKNGYIVYFHGPPISVKTNKNYYNTQHTCIHKLQTHSYMDAWIFSRRSGSRYAACTLLPLTFDVLPKMSSGVKERFFFYSPPNTQPNPPKHTHTPTSCVSKTICRCSLILVAILKHLSPTPPPLPHSFPIHNRVRTSFYCYLIAGLQSSRWPFQLFCVVQQMCSLQ